MQTITQHILTDQMDYQDTVVLNCQIRYPQLNASCNQEAIQARRSSRIHPADI